MGTFVTSRTVEPASSASSERFFLYAHGFACGIFAELCSNASVLLEQHTSLGIRAVEVSSINGNNDDTNFAYDRVGIRDDNPAASYGV
jgi:hypothetical protein